MDTTNNYTTLPPKPERNGEFSGYFEITCIHPVQQNESKLCIYKELKREVEFEECLDYAKEVDSILFFNFRSDTHGLFEKLGRHVASDGSQKCPTCAV